MSGWECSSCILGRGRPGHWTSAWGDGDQEMRPEKVLGGVAVVPGLSASSVQAMAFTVMGWQSRQGMKIRSSVVEELG